MKILLVEDETEKRRRITEVMLEVTGVDLKDIVSLDDAHSAKRYLLEQTVDLLLIDINLPKKMNMSPETDGGLDVVRWLKREVNTHRAHHIVGITAYDASHIAAQEEFNNHVWSLVRYSHSTDQWIGGLKETLRLIISQIRPPYRNDGVTFRYDLGIVVALEGVELEGILALPANWKETPCLYDTARYYSGEFGDTDPKLQVVVVAASNKGLPFAAIAATKLINAFRPKYLAMTGICAGVKGKVNIGDVVFADPSWDWGSGKIKLIAGKEVLHAAPYQLRANENLRIQAKKIAKDRDLLDSIKTSYQHSKPKSDINIHVGAVASGGSVLQSTQAMKKILSTNKDLVALDMEVFGLLCACGYSTEPKPIGFAFKSISDFGDNKKNDKYQKYAAYSSANVLYRFAINSLSISNEP